ncbi:hypothetical protein PG985_014726 [Apiospora marii]|uniref:uncharacterized protein n=1 Tax=Apiospora marii TaxID=335849 RepID=UPI00312F450F
MLMNAYPQTEVLPYGYDASSMRSLDDLLDSNSLEQKALAFLQDMGKMLQHHETVQEGDAGKTETKKTLQHPLIILAHGYGGLIYEKALVISHQQKGNPSFEFFARLHQRAFLFGTPHFSAGLGEWAIMCARRRGFPCAKTARKQKWEASTEESVDSIRTFQSSLREILKGQDKLDPTIQIFGCFATSPDTDTKLMLSSKWAIMPEFRALSVNEDHFGMTKLNRSSKHFDRVFDTLDHQFIKPSAIEPQPDYTPMGESGDKLTGKVQEEGSGLGSLHAQLAKDPEAAEPTPRLLTDDPATCDFDDWVANRVFKVFLGQSGEGYNELADALVKQLKARISGDIQVVPVDREVYLTQRPSSGVLVESGGPVIYGLETFFMPGQPSSRWIHNAFFGPRSPAVPEDMIYRLPMRSHSMGAPQSGIRPPFRLDVLYGIDGKIQYVFENTSNGKLALNVLHFRSNFAITKLLPRGDETLGISPSEKHYEPVDLIKGSSDFDLSPLPYLYDVSLQDHKFFQVLRTIVTMESEVSFESLKLPRLEKEVGRDVTETQKTIKKVEPLTHLCWVSDIRIEIPEDCREAKLEQESPRLTPIYNILC